MNPAASFVAVVEPAEVAVAVRKRNPARTAAGTAVVAREPGVPPPRNNWNILPVGVGVAAVVHTGCTERWEVVVPGRQS